MKLLFEDARKNEENQSFFTNLKQHMRKIFLKNKVEFEKIFREYYRPLCYYSFKIVNDLDMSKSIVQDFFVKIWEAQNSFANEKLLHAYLYNGVKNNSLKYLEKENNRRLLEEKLLVENADTSVASEEELEAELMNEIYNAIEKLPPRCKEVFKLSYIRNLDVEEVARELNISENTVKMQRRIAKKMIRENCNC